MEGVGVGKRRVVIATGEIDLQSAPELLDRLLSAASHGDADVVVDSAGVTFLDSTGLAAFALTHNRLVELDHKLVVRDPQPNVRLVLEITGMDTVLAIEETDGPSSAN